MAQQLEDLSQGKYIYVQGSLLRKAIDEHVRGALRPTLDALLDSVESSVPSKSDAIALLVALNTGDGQDLNPQAMSVKAALNRLSAVTKQVDNLTTLAQYLFDNHIYRIEVEQASYYGL